MKFLLTEQELEDLKSRIRTNENKVSELLRELKIQQEKYESLERENNLVTKENQRLNEKNIYLLGKRGVLERDQELLIGENLRLAALVNKTAEDIPITFMMKPTDK